ncbi:MAG: PGF-pre-PGF domain-containing protein [Nanoarchaeota archaeon]|nr:PGF-pre-PGF domain-containing protein [Nanoarchaeota archaeon]
MNSKGLIGAVKYGILSIVIILVVMLFVFPAFAVPETGSPIFVEVTNESITNNSQYAPLTNYGFEINITNSTENHPGNCTFTANFSGIFRNYTAISSDIPVMETIDVANNQTNCYINFVQDHFTGAGLYYYEWFVNGTDNGAWNQTSNVTYVIAQNTTTDSWMNLTIDGAEANLTKQYSGDAMNVTANYSTSVFTEQNIQFNFYRNTTTDITASGPNNQSETWGVGNVYYDYNTSGNANYSATSKHFHFNITQNTSNLALLYLNGYQTDISVTSGTSVNATAAKTHSGIGTLRLYLDNVLLSTTYQTTTKLVGTYVYKANITGNANYSNSSTVTRTLTVTLASSGGTGGTGGSTTIEQTVEINTIPAGQTKTMTFTDADLGIPKVMITAKNEMTNAVLKITKLTTLPSNVDSPTGTVYKYFNFVQTRMEDEDISKVKIQFKVAKSWVEFNEIDLDTIVMKRWNEGWEKLSTKQVSDDSTNYLFEATSTGFSYFIIEGTQFAEPADETVDTSETVEETERSNTWIWVLVILIIAGVVGYYYYENVYKKRTPWKNLHNKWRN